MGPGEDHKGHRGHSPGVQVQGRATPSVANSPQALGRPLSTLSPKRKSFCNLLPLAWPLEWPEEESQRSRGTASSRREQGADPSGTSSAVGAPLPTGAPRREPPEHPGGRGERSREKAGLLVSRATHQVSTSTLARLTFHLNLPPPPTFPTLPLRAPPPGSATIPAPKAGT